MYLRPNTIGLCSVPDEHAVDETGNRQYLLIKTRGIRLAVLKHKRDEIWAAAYAENASTKHSWLSDRVVNYNQRQTEMRRKADVCSDFVQECLTNKHETIIKEAFELCFP